MLLELKEEIKRVTKYLEKAYKKKRILIATVVIKTVKKNIKIK